MKMGETTTPVDWNSVLTNATNFATAYLGYRSQVKGGSGQPAPTPTPLPAPAPAPMSNTTKTLLIGGAVIAAGLLIYSMTNKK